MGHVPECCGYPMIARATAMIFDCLGCGRSVTALQLVDGIKLTSVPRSVEVLYTPYDKLFPYRYFDGQVWSYGSQ